MNAWVGMWSPVVRSRLVANNSEEQTVAIPPWVQAEVRVTVTGVGCSMEDGCWMG